MQQTETRWDTTTFGVVTATFTYAAVVTATQEGKTRRTTYEYDPAHQGGAQYGNLTATYDEGDITVTGDERTIRQEYYPMTGTAWIVNKPALQSTYAKSALQSSSDGEPSWVTQTVYYDGASSYTTPPVHGAATRTERSGSDATQQNVYTGYGSWGNPEVITDALGRTTHTQYDTVYNLYPVVITNALTQTTRYGYDLVGGLVLTATDANSIETYYRYDALGRLLSATNPGETIPAVKYTYPISGAWAAPFVITTETRIDAYTAPTYQRAWTVYDGLGRAIQTQVEAENGWLVVQSTGYGARGQTISATLPYTLVASGGVYHPPDWNTLSKSVTQYDALGRPTLLTAPDGITTTHVYTGWRELILDANGHQTQYEKDGLGRLKVVKEYSGQYAAPDWNAEAQAVTRYWYDARDNLIAVRDAQDNATRIAYDGLGRKTSMDDPSMGHWEYEYDLAGNLITQTDALGQQMVFEYDELNRVSKKWKVEGGTWNELAWYEYDQGTNGIGRRTAMTDTTGVTRWQYNKRGQVLTETRTIDSAMYTTAWGYDAAGRTITTAYSTGEVVSTDYNERGLVSSLAGWSSYLVGASYTALGQPEAMQWGNNLTTNYAYWPGNQRLKQLQVSDLLNLQYAYDPVGNVATITDTINSSQAQHFLYDARDRLTQAWTTGNGNGPYTQAWGYDGMGNIVTRTLESTSEAYTYGRPTEPVSIPVTMTYKAFFPLITRDCVDCIPSATFNQPFAVISTTGGFRAEYDLNGNMLVRVEVSGTQRITYTQAWNAENRLSVVTNTISDSVTSFFYDGDGNRVKRVVSDTAGVTTTVYVSGLFEKNVTAGVTTTYYYAGSTRVAMREQTLSTNVVYYLHADHLGSTSLTTDNSGDFVARQLYHPFGTPRWNDGTLPTDYKFTGQRSEEAGLGSLYDYGARFYSPYLNRWLSPDTIVPQPGNPQSLNRYSYGYNNPVKYQDPSGHVPCPDGQCEPRSSLSKLAKSLAPSIEFVAPLFDMRRSGNGYNAGTHPGQDYGLPTDSTIHASGNGVVIVADACPLQNCVGQLGNTGADVNGGYGNVIIIEYPYNSLPERLQSSLGLQEGESAYILYGHMRDAPTLKPGDVVETWQVIGNVGNTGNSDGAHLHDETRIGQTGSLPLGVMCPNNDCYAGHARFDTWYNAWQNPKSRIQFVPIDPNTLLYYRPPEPRPME